MRPRTLAPILALAACVAVVIPGCSPKAKQTQDALGPRYAVQPPRQVPEWLRGSILEQVDLTSIEPYPVSNYGLVVLKRPTGDAVTAPNNVREYIIREMVRRGFGSKNVPGFEDASPEQVLRDERVAIVRVDGVIPAGAVVGQGIDVQVSALEDSNTTSLAGGTLFTTSLSPGGANPNSPGNTVDEFAVARGYVFVNPAYALDPDPTDASQRRSLTVGTVQGRVLRPRPLGLQIRAAERRLSRMTEQRINLLVADSDAASAQDEGLVFVKVPASYRGDWERFAGVMLHTFYNADQTFQTMKARQLVEIAQRPDAPLLDVSYTWEALGKPALPEIEPLFTHARHDVAYAAARAAAFIGDTAAEAALAAMAADPANPLRVGAVQTLAAIPTTPSISVALRELMKVGDATVRIEAYKGLVANDDVSVSSTKVGEKFILDVVDNEGPTLIYASSVGLPRVAFIGSTARLPAPTFFTAMNNELSISPVEQRRDLLTLFYRGAGVPQPVKQLTTPDLAEIVARLGGEGPVGQPRMDFTYGEIVALLGKLSDAGLVVGPSRNKAEFVLQELPNVSRDVNNAPIIPDGPRPVTTAE